MCYTPGMKVEFYKTPSGRKPVEDFILGLSAGDQGEFAGVKRGIEKYGLKCPLVIFKNLSGKLWEVKFSGEGGKYRIAYVVITGPEMVWLHAFKKKTQKTPKDDLELSLKRMKEVLDHEKAQKNR